MSTKSRRNRPVMIYVDDGDLAVLDHLADQRQTSRSAAARSLLHPALVAEARRIANEAPPVGDAALAVIRAAGIPPTGSMRERAVTPIVYVSERERGEAAS